MTGEKSEQQIDFCLSDTWQGFRSYLQKKNTAKKNQWREQFSSNYCFKNVGTKNETKNFVILKLFRETKKRFSKFIYKFLNSDAFPKNYLLQTFL